MPDKASIPVYDKCTSCAFASEKGPVFSSWPTSHTDVCCLYKFNRLEQSALCHLKDVGRKPNDTSDGLCKDCPSRLKPRELQVELPVQEPPQNTSDDVASPEDVPPSCTSVHAGTRKGSRIAPRKRRGFSKLTIEIRPPKFKKKLWFGTWQEEEIDRARDAINYYMGSNEPYVLADSPLIFAQRPLGIEYRDLKPACEEYVQVGQRRVRASVYFARRVKEVIKSVTRGGKKKAQPLKKPLKSKLVSEPLMSCSSGSPSSPCAPGSTTSSIMPCASGSQFSSADDMVWYGASSEANSELASFLPPYDSYEGDSLPIESELFSLCNWSEEVFPLEEVTRFSSFPSFATSGEGEGESETALMEDNSFTGFFWS